MLEGDQKARILAEGLGQAGGLGFVESRQRLMRLDPQDERKDYIST